MGFRKRRSLWGSGGGGVCRFQKGEGSVRSEGGGACEVQKGEEPVSLFHIFTFFCFEFFLQFAIFYTFFFLSCVVSNLLAFM